MILIGDIHGFFASGILYKAAMGDDTVIQVGDLGFWPYLREEWERYTPPKPIYFIEGNHDYAPPLVALTEPTEVWPNLIYLPRGTVKEIDGKRVAFCGGATSVDYKWRHKGKDWFDEEVIRVEDVERFRGVKKIDILVTHSPPDRAIRRNFPEDGLRAFGIYPATWRDPSAERVEEIWKMLGQPTLYCGHMHKSVEDGKIHILNTEEVVKL